MQVKGTMTVPGIDMAAIMTIAVVVIGGSGSGWWYYLED